MKTIKLTFTTLAALAVALEFQPPTMRAAAAKYSDWSAPVNLGPIINSAGADQGPALSRNGLSLYFTAVLPGGIGGSADMWVSQRTSLEAPWGPPRNLGPNINSSGTEGLPSFSPDRHWMYFNSDRPGGFGGFDLWSSWRANTRDDFGWQPCVNLGSGVNTAALDCCSTFFDNEEAGKPLLFFTRDVVGGTVDSRDIYVSAQAADGTFGPATLVAELSSPLSDGRPTIRFDGLEIFLNSNRGGSVGLNDLWTSTRETVFSPWSPPVNVGPVINTTLNDAQPHLSSDARFLFFSSNRPGTLGDLDSYVSTRADLGITPHFINISALNRIGAGTDVLTAGFTLVGTGTKNILIRAVGPGLAGLGVGGALTDPKLVLYDSNRGRIAENDNWSADLSNSFRSVGAFSLAAGGKDAALAVNLSPGAYTVQISGADGGGGVALLEVYEIP